MRAPNCFIMAMLSLLSLTVYAGTGLNLRVYNYTGAPLLIKGDINECMKIALPEQDLSIANELSEFDMEESNQGSCYGRWSSEKVIVKAEGGALAELTIKMQPGFLGNGYRLKIVDRQVFDSHYEIYTYPEAVPIATWSKTSASLVISRAQR